VTDARKEDVVKTTNERHVGSPTTSADDERSVRTLYEGVLEHWNARDATRMARLFTRDCHLVGFDGSQTEGRAAVESEMTRIFANHPTARYVGIVRQVQFLSQTVAALRAVAGMVPPGETDLNPGLNAVQTLIATKDDASWRVALYQNTPAAFHGRPEAVKALTDELRQQMNT
jgi:uncharacterized protein (TIGR02246 family)